MILKISAAALVLALAVPVVAQTAATITQGPTDRCASATASAGTATTPDCPAAKPAKLGSGIIPLTGSDSDSGADEGEGEDD